MLFTEPTFLFVFLPVLLALYFAPRLLQFSRTEPVTAVADDAQATSRPTSTLTSGRNWLLVIASVVFYARGAAAFTSLILASIVINYGAALLVDRWRGTRRGRATLAAAIALNLSSLAAFKYAGFLTTNANLLLRAVGGHQFPVPEVLLPIGISFFTFHSISYIVDVYRRDAAAQKRPVEAALYLLLFPQLIAGPIIRYREIANQLSNRHDDVGEFAVGVRRFIVGLGKKMLIANIVAVPADRIFEMPTAELTAAHAWLAVVCYTLQIYFDFSGYSDMAIGLGRMFGFRFPENFRYPYIAASVQEFWRRWHMTLSAWFRDYLYVPLGGNRVGSARLYVNLLTVFFLCGLWHGASWTFVVWGLWHGLFLVLERLGLGAMVSRAPRPLRHVYALLVVMVGWVFFRADSLTHAVAMLGAMAGLGAHAPTVYAVSWYLSPELLVALVAGIVGAVPLLSWLSAREHGAVAMLRPALANVALLVVLFASVMLIAARTYNPFIYFKF
jgi:alginate O-acetyltransferase complex protein AlgI